MNPSTTDADGNTTRTSHSDPVCLSFLTGNVGTAPPGAQCDFEDKEEETLVKRKNRKHWLFSDPCNGP